MKNTTTRPPQPIRRMHPRPAPTPTPDPLQQHATQRRLYTDFLALAMYPGMSPRRTDHAA